MSERGSNSDEERAVVVEEKAENNNNNNNNNNKNEAAEDAALDQHQRDHSGLLTIGEKCVHLICEFIRLFDSRSVILGEMVEDGAVTLSRLSRTCRALYIYVRNLPSVLELPQPPFSWMSLPWGAIGLDVGYWSDIGGLVWKVSDPQQLLFLAAPMPANYSMSTHSCKERNAALLGSLFLHVHSLISCEAFTGAECAEILRVLELCGGLCFNLYDEADPIPSLGLDLRRCKNLRYLHVSVDLTMDAAYKSYEVMVQQLSEMEVKPQYASINVEAIGPGMMTDLSVLSYFQCIRVNAPPDLRSIHGVEDARFVSLRNLCLTDVSALGSVHTVLLSDCNDITDASALCNVHTLCLRYCDGITDISALSTVKELEIRFCNRVLNLDALPNLTRGRKVIIDLTGDLSGARSVDLSYRDDVTDVSMLGHAHTLNLTRCIGISDVSMLGKVHTLNLSQCSYIDVSALGGVHSLNLSQCRNIMNVSMLGSVHTLDLSSCNNISDVSMLGSVHTLSLAWCNWLTDVSPLATVHRLNLSFCNGITDVSSLENVTRLCLNGCENVTNASTLINKVLYLVY